jgi:hypothetical protein
VGYLPKLFLAPGQNPENGFPLSVESSSNLFGGVTVVTLVTPMLFSRSRPSMSEFERW